MSSCDTANAMHETNHKLITDTISKVNTMVSSVSNNGSGGSNSCQPGSQCYINKVSNELLQIYNNAKRTAATAPGDLEVAKENYYKFILGDKYIEFLRQEIEKKADVYISEKTNEFFMALNMTVLVFEDYIIALRNIRYGKTLNTLIEGEKANNMLEGFESSLLPNGNVLSEKSQSSNETALSKTLGIYLNDTKNMTNLNERKVFYEQESYDSLIWWYKVWFYTYIFLLVVFLISIFLVNNNNSFMTNMGILTLFIAYIFIAKPILYLIVYLVKQINSLLPKNIYLSLNDDSTNKIFTRNTTPTVTNMFTSNIPYLS